MEARAVKRFTPGSARKMRLLADLIRGKSVEEALNILHYSSKHASSVIEQTLRSAIANYLSKPGVGKIVSNQVFIKKITVDGGPMVKRIMPAPMGRAFRVRKRMSHLTIVVDEIDKK
ncbi:MAG: 50S ribosomal protein L22 [Chlorobi bacterium]|nr:50S ribosomal protein L22 [Chlorobiota bacterium]